MVLFSITKLLLRSNGSSLIKVILEERLFLISPLIGLFPLNIYNRPFLFVVPLFVCQANVPDLQPITDAIVFLRDHAENATVSVLLIIT